MSAEAFVTVEDKKLTPDELRQMLMDAFDAGAKLGFDGFKEGAIREIKLNNCTRGCEVRIEDMCGPNVFALMVGFDDYIKKKGGKT